MVRGFPISERFHCYLENRIRQNLLRVVVRHRSLGRDLRIRIRVDVVREFHFVEDSAVVDVLHRVPGYVEVPPDTFDSDATVVNRVW